MSKEESRNTPSQELHEEAAMPYHPEADALTSAGPAIERVRQRHERALLDIPGVTGVGIGRSPIGDDALVVYLRDASVRSRVPGQVEGYPVQTTVTGEIDAYRGR